jgi:hypothetical protein
MRIQLIIRRFAGSFVLVSLALGWWVNPLWFLFTAFVGLNLFQSSFTNFCPLERILVRLRHFEKHGDPGPSHPGRI